MNSCLYCESEHLRKNGKLSSGGQRRKCVDCSKQFSSGGARETYSPKFKEQVVDEYCHSTAKAKDVIKKYEISSRTLIQRKKNHINNCDQCNSPK